MSRLSFSLGIAVCFSLVRFIEAQCVTDGYLPCYPAGGSDSGGSGGLPLVDADFPAEYDILNNAVDTDLAKRGVAPRLLFSRQNALCCSPTDRCLVFTNGDIPFCYDPDTTRFGFSDNSFGFISNATYYAADGTFVDFKDGYYSSTDGSTGTFATATAAATAAASSSDVGAAATSTTAGGALANQSPTTSSSSDVGAPATSTTAAGARANQAPTTSSSSVASTRQSSVTAPTNSPSRSSGGSSGGVIVMPSRVIGWLGLGVGFFGVLLA